MTIEPVSTVAAPATVLSAAWLQRSRPGKSLEQAFRIAVAAGVRRRECRPAPSSAAKRTCSGFLPEVKDPRSLRAHTPERRVLGKIWG